MASLIVLVAALLLLVVAALLVVQLRTVVRQLEAIAGDWRREVVELVREAAGLAETARAEAAGARTLLEERTTDVEALDRVTRGLLETITFPVASLGRLRLGVRRAKEVFGQRRDGTA